MFDPIKGPSNHYQAPATGLGTEAGDTWHEAVRKINAGFKNVIMEISGDSEATDPEARQRITELEEAITALQKKNDALIENMALLEREGSDCTLKVDALERRLNDAAQAPAPTAEKTQG